MINFFKSFFEPEWVDQFENDDNQIQFITEPFQHQREGIDRINSFNGVCLLGDEMGLGKSYQVLVSLRQNLDWLPAVIVCPANLKTNWQREAWDHTGFRANILKGTRSSWVEPTRIMIINYDILPYWVGYLKQVGVKTVIFDEAQMMSNHDSLRSKVCRSFAQNLPHRMALTGQPVNNVMADLYPILHIIKPDIYPNVKMFNQLLESGQLQSHIRRALMIRRKNVDVYGENKLKRQVYSVKLDNKRDYDIASTQYVRYLRAIDVERADAALLSAALTRTTFLKKMASDSKMNHVVKWIKDHDFDKLICVFTYKSTLNRVKDSFPNNCVLIDGSQSLAQRQKAIDRFANDPQIRLMLINIEAGGTGWNGVAASNILFVDLPWTPGKLRQAEARIDRIGQTDSPTAHYIIAQGTIEEKICALLQAKQRQIIDNLDGNGYANENLSIHTELLKAMKPGFWSSLFEMA